MITKTVGNKKVKVYRAYSIIASFRADGRKNFSEKIATIDSRGFFITIEDTEGVIDPKTIALTRKQSWVTKAKIKLVVSPIK